MGLFNRNKSPEEKRYEELTGGFLVSDDYIAILEANGLNTIDGEKIRERVKKEIKNGSLTTDDILGRLDYLIKEKSRIKGHNPRGYDLTILHPNITTPVKHTEDLSDKTDDELMDMLPKFCSNCGNKTELIYVVCPNCQAYIWNPISDTLIRRFIKHYFDFGEAIDDEYHANFTIVNELKSKGYSIQSIFLSNLCTFLSYLSMTDNIISDKEVEFINDYLSLNYNKNRIIEIIGKIDKNYKDKLPISFIIAHELDNELQDGNNYLEFTNNFYQTFGALFITCDSKIDPKEKSIFLTYCDNLEKNVKKLSIGKYELDYNDLDQDYIKSNGISKTNSSSNPNICSKCGFENRPKVKFCTNCGNKMKN